MRHPVLSGLSILLALVLSGCQASLPDLPAWQAGEGRDSAQLGQIRDLATGEQLTPEQLVAYLAPAPRVLVGEKHDNPDHHALQLWLLRAGGPSPQGSLLLEMLQPSQQPLIDAVQGQAVMPEDLPKALAWQDGWDWQWYGRSCRRLCIGRLRCWRPIFRRRSCVRLIGTPRCCRGRARMHLRSRLRC